MVMEMEKIIQEKVEKEMQELKSRMKKCYYSKSGVNEAEKYIKGLLQQFHFRLIISAFRKPMVNIFSRNSQKSRFNKLIESFRRTCFPFA